MATKPEHGLIPLGAGPVATVYRTVHPETGGPVALKVYPERPDRRTLAEFEREQAVLATLPVASSVLRPDTAVALPDGRWGLRMELCPGSLGELVVQVGKLPLTDVAVYGETLATVLAHSHAAGIVHGGVTPPNLIFRPTGQALLSDFGLSLRQRFPRDPSAGVGHLAPEVLRGEDPDELSDLYGLGSLLYLGLTGRSPFPARPGEHAGLGILRVLTEEPPRVGDDIQESVADLVARLLAKSPADRPQTAAEVATELTRLLTPADPAPQEAVPLSMPASAPSPDSRAVGRTPAEVADEGDGSGQDVPQGPRPDSDASEEAGPDGAAFIDDLFGGPDSTGATEVDIDDFRDQPEVTDSAPAARPAARPIAVVGATSRRSDSRSRRPAGPGPVLQTRHVIAGVGLGLLGLLAVGSVLFLSGMNRSDPATDGPPGSPVASTDSSIQPSTAPSPQPSSPPLATPPPVVQLELANPVDRRTYVELSWRGSVSLDFAVIAAEQGKPEPKVHFVKRKNNLRLAIDPNLSYCFQVQATDGRQLYESQAKPIRGATCRG